MNSRRTRVAPLKQRRKAIVVAEPEKCRTPGKLGYRDKADAKAAVKRGRRMNGRGAVEAYRCSCGYWHIGHRPGSNGKPQPQD